MKVILIVCIRARKSGSDARVGVGGTRHAAKSTLKHALNIDCETDFANAVDMWVMPNGVGMPSCIIDVVHTNHNVFISKVHRRYQRACSVSRVVRSALNRAENELTVSASATLRIKSVRSHRGPILAWPYLRRSI